MSDKPDKESQTEEATEKRLQDSIEKGDTPFSREAALAASLIAALLYCSFFLRSGATRLAVLLQQLLDKCDQIPLSGGRNADALFVLLAEAAGVFLLPTLVLFAVAALAASFGQNPPRIASERITPKWDRVSPLAGWSRLVSPRGATEFVKSLAKLLAVGFIVAIVLKNQLIDSIAGVYSDPSGLPAHLLAIGLRLLAGVTAAVCVLAAADIVWSRLHWKRDLRMSRQDVKDEQKQLLGDPMVKARLRSVALERSRKRMMSAVPTATLVVANPTHYAIALRYVRAEGGAPKVVAKGQDLIALKIREIAEEHDIPVVEDKALARSMYDRVEVDMMIPPEFYRVIAELIHFLSGRGAGQRRQ